MVNLVSMLTRSLPPLFGSYLSSFGWPALAIGFFLAASTLLLVLSMRVKRLRAETVNLKKTLSRLSSEMEAQALLARQLSLDLKAMRTPPAQSELPVHAPAWPKGDLSLNLNTRGQVLRLSRKGKTVPEIAADLKVSRGEVDLLLKVHGFKQAALGQEIALEQA